MALDRILHGNQPVRSEAQANADRMERALRLVAEEFNSGSHRGSWLHEQVLDALQHLPQYREHRTAALARSKHA